MANRKHRPVLYEVVRRSKLTGLRDARKPSPPAAPAAPGGPWPGDAPAGAAGAPPERGGAPADRAASPAARGGAPRDRAGATTGRTGAPAERGGAAVDRTGAAGERGGALLGRAAEPFALAPQTTAEDYASADAPAGRGAGTLDSWKHWLTEARFRLTVSPLGAAIVGIAVVLVLFVTFEAGVRSARLVATRAAQPSTPGDDARLAALAEPPAAPRSNATTPVGAAEPPSSPTTSSGDAASMRVQPSGSPARAEPPGAARAETPVGPQPAAEEEPADAAFEFEKDAYYVVIQHFRKSESAAADRAAEYLKSQGVDCTLRRRGSEIRLIATAAFRLSAGDAGARQRERQRLDELKKQVIRLGKDYAREGGYSFDRCYELKF